MTTKEELLLKTAGSYLEHAHLGLILAKDENPHDVVRSEMLEMIRIHIQASQNALKRYVELFKEP